MAKVTERKLVSFDWAVKKLLRSKANFVVLEGFLSELLFDDIKILEILESESNKEDENDKFNRVDIKVKNAKGEIIIVEVQFDEEVDFFQRILYATSKNVCEHLVKGQKYRDVAKIISVNILYFNLGEGSDYIYKGGTAFYGLHNRKRLKLNPEQKERFKKEYPDDLFPEYYIIKVNNFDDVAKSPLDEWIYLLKNSAIKSSFRAKGIKEAGRALDVMKMPDEERRRYERYLDLKMSARSQYYTAIMKGEFRERKKQEAKIKQLEDKYSKELQEEKNKHKEELQAMAKLLLENRLSKEKILEKTGIKL